MLTFVVAILASFGLFAQQPDPAPKKQKEKKVIIIKTIDENGEEKEETIILDGEGENVWISQNGEVIEIDPSEESVILLEKEEMMKELEAEMMEMEEKRIEVEVEVERIMEEMEEEMESVEREPQEMEIKVRVLEEGEEPHIIHWHSKGKEPISEEVLEQLEKEGIVLEDFQFIHGNRAPKAFLGVMISQTKEEENGVEENSGIVISELVADGPAEKAGVETGDIITGIDGNALGDFSELLDYLDGKEPGEEVSLEVDRNGSMKKIAITLGEKQAHRVHDILWMDEDGEGDETIIIIEGANGKKVKKYKKKHSKMQKFQEEDFDIKLGGNLDLQNLKVGPNPSTDVVSLSFDSAEKGDLDIQVLNLNGQTIYKEYMSDFSGNYAGDLDLGGQVPGTYLLRIQQGTKQWVEELILQ